MKILHLNFVPRSADLSLLILRLWFGTPLFLLHGWSKLVGYSTMAHAFPDPLQIGHPLSWGLTIFSEVLCAALIVLGLFTRIAALVAIIEYCVAFWLVHGHRLSGPGSGELAYLYLGAFLLLFIAGPGKMSVDGKIGGSV